MTSGRRRPPPATGPSRGNPQTAGAISAAGLRQTRAREAVLAAFVEAESPLAMADVEDRLASEGIPQSTIYRVVSELVQAGLLRRYEFDEGFARFEPGEEIRGHHHHFVCRSCGDVAEVEVLPELERHLGRAEAILETAEGLRVEGHRLDLFGTCGSCLGGGA